MSCQPCGCDPEANHVCAQHEIDVLKTHPMTDRTIESPVFRDKGPLAMPRQLALPTDSDARKALPIFTGLLMYFPLACLAVAEVSRLGNEQHNPGEPLHWARHKSTDQTNTALRHLMDHGLGNVKDTDGAWHLAKAAWRILAELELTIEKGNA